MTEWGATALGMTLEAGLMGAWLILAVVALRPKASWRAGLLLLGLAQFLVPPVLVAPLPRPVLVMGVDLGLDVRGGLLASGELDGLAALALAQLAGLAVGGALLLRSALGLRRTLRRATPVRSGPVHRALRRVAEGQGIATPRLYLTDGEAPGATGVLRPAVLLPRRLARSLDHQSLRMVLAHETAHLARRDPLASVARHLTVALWWFHPVAWALARMHRRAAEDACDDVATTDADPDAYCTALLAAAGPPAPMTAGLGDHPLERRFRRLLGRPATGLAPRLGAARPWLLAAIAAAAVIAGPVQLLSFTTDPAAERASETTVLRHETVIRHVIK